MYCLLYHLPCAQLKPFYLFKFDKINTGVKPFNQTVICATQDSVGFMWFGTSNGLYSYDGNTFKQFEFKDLVNIEIRSLYVDSKKNLWIGTTWEQLYEYDMYHHKLTHYLFNPASRGINSGQVYTIQEGINNTLWVATGEGLLLLNTVTGKFAHKTIKPVRSICKFNDTLFTGLVTGGIQCYDYKTNQPLKTPGRWQFLAQNNYSVNYLYTGKNNYLWVGTNAGLFMQDAGGAITKLYNQRNLPDNYIYSITDENNGLYTWVSTPKGIALYDHSISSFAAIQNGIDVNAASIVEKRINYLYEDVSGKIWTCTDKFGIYSFYPRKIKLYRHSKTDANSLHSNELKRVFSFNNALVAAVYGDGIDVLNIATNACTFYPFRFIQYPAERDSSSIFVGGDTGLFIFDINTRRYTPALPPNINNLKNVQAARYDNHGNLWIGCEQGNGGVYVYNYKKAGLRKFRIGEKGLLSENVNLITTDTDGEVIICNYSSTQKYNSRVDSFMYLTRNKELLYTSAGICFQPGSNGISLAGSYQNGIYIVNKNLEVSGLIDETKGLSSNTVLSFLADEPNTVWATTVWGVNKITFANGYGSKYTISHLDNTDGLPAEMVINMAALQQKGETEKTYYLSTIDGLVAAKASAFYPNPYKPPVVITSLAVSDTVINTGDSSHLLSMPVYLTKKVHLSYTQNSLQLTFAALNYINSPKNRYAYMLQGVDRDWIYTTSNYSSNYSNLKPGTYTFLVKAANDAGVWNNTPAQIQFIIKPPFWLTIWAYLLYTLVVAAMVYGFFMYRIHQFKVKQEAQLRTMIATQEQERKRISRDLHDDVGTKLSALKLFVSTFKNNLQKQNYIETQMLAKSTEELIDETISDVRVMLMNLSPGILEEFGFVTAIEGLVNKLNDTKTMYIKLVIFGVTHRLKKDYELALYRITQELLNNVMKHAGATNVSLQVGYRDEKIILMIEDDGKGFDVTTHKEGYGLKNLDARTKLLQGTMMIDSSPGNGTSVLIEIPYQFN